MVTGQLAKGPSPEPAWSHAEARFVHLGHGLEVRAPPQLLPVVIDGVHGVSCEQRAAPEGDQVVQALQALG